MHLTTIPAHLGFRSIAASTSVTTPCARFSTVMEVSLASCNAPLEPCKGELQLLGWVVKHGTCINRSTQNGKVGRVTISDDHRLISSKSWIGQSLRREVSVMAQAYQQVNLINIGSPVLKVVQQSQSHYIPFNYSSTNASKENSSLKPGTCMKIPGDPKGYTNW